MLHQECRLSGSAGCLKAHSGEAAALLVAIDPPNEENPSKQRNLTYLGALSLSINAHELVIDVPVELLFVPLPSATGLS